MITRAHVLTENWRALYDEVRAMREACGDAHIKTILATGELGTLRNVARASLVCMMAGADFIKTSTGKESVNATLPVGLVMARAIRDYRERTGHAGRAQAGRRHPHREGGAGLAGADQGRAGRPLAPSRPVPLRRQLAADRHRAAAGALRDRTVFGRAPASTGRPERCEVAELACRPRSPEDLSPWHPFPNLRDDGVRSRPRGGGAGARVAGAARPRASGCSSAASWTEPRTARPSRRSIRPPASRSRG